MKIGVVSDTHISDKTDKLPQKLLEAFKKVDMIIHAGDMVDQSVLEQLKESCANITAVRGNMDNAGIKLKEKEIIKIGKYRIGIAHGYGAPAGLINILTKLFKDDKVDIIIFGHSHKPVNEKIKNILYFNPGSPTDKIFADYNSYGIIEIDGDKLEGKIIKL